MPHPPTAHYKNASQGRGEGEGTRTNVRTTALERSLPAANQPIDHSCLFLLPPTTVKNKFAPILPNSTTTLASRQDPCRRHATPRHNTPRSRGGVRGVPITTNATVVQQTVVADHGLHVPAIRTAPKRAGAATRRILSPAQSAFHTDYRRHLRHQIATLAFSLRQTHASRRGNTSGPPRVAPPARAADYT